MGGSGGSLGDKASGNVALGYHIGQGRRSWRAFSPPPPSVSFADLYQRAPPIPLYFSLAINTAVPFYVRDEFNFNNIVLPEPQFCVFLLRRTCLLPRCVWKYQLPLPVVIVVLGNGSLAFSIWFPPTVPCSSAPSNPDSSQPRHHRPSLLRCSTSFMPSTRLTDASDGNTSMWFPRGLLMRHMMLGLTASPICQPITVIRLKSSTFEILPPYLFAPPVSPPHFFPHPPPPSLTQSYISVTLRFFIRILLGCWRKISWNFWNYNMSESDKGREFQT